MATNIEIKARVGDPAGLKERIEKICGPADEVLLQEDTFFRIPKGRLKLRVAAPGPEEDVPRVRVRERGPFDPPERAPGPGGQLIYYERSDIKGPKRSDYLVVEIPDPAGLKALLAAILAIRGTVRKTRRLYILGRTRIHLDEVEGLGSFMELEVVTDPGRSTSEENIGGEKASEEGATGGKAAGQGAEEKATGGNASGRKTAAGKKTDERAREEGEAEAAVLMKKLGIDEADLVDGAYIDLLEAGRDRKA